MFAVFSITSLALSALELCSFPMMELNLHPATICPAAVIAVFSEKSLAMNSLVKVWTEKKCCKHHI